MTNLAKANQCNSMKRSPKRTNSSCSSRRSLTRWARISTSCVSNRTHRTHCFKPTYRNNHSQASHSCRTQLRIAKTEAKVEEQPKRRGGANQASYSGRLTKQAKTVTSKGLVVERKKSGQVLSKTTRSLCQTWHPQKYPLALRREVDRKSRRGRTARKWETTTSCTRRAELTL